MMIEWNLGITIHNHSPNLLTPKFGISPLSFLAFLKFFSLHLFSLTSPPRNIPLSHKVKIYFFLSFPHPHFLLKEKRKEKLIYLYFITKRLFAKQPLVVS